MLDEGTYDVYDPVREKRRKKLTLLWLVYYVNWNGSDRKRDIVIRNKVNAGKIPPL